MDDIVVIIILVFLVGLASFYLYRAKKKGKKCIGCPYADSCGANKTACSCCGGSGNETETGTSLPKDE